MPIRKKPLKEDQAKKNILHAILFSKDKFSLNRYKDKLFSFYIVYRIMETINQETAKTPLKSHKSMLKYLKNRYENDEEYRQKQIQKAKSKYESNKERYHNDEEYRLKRIEHSRKCYKAKKEARNK